MKQNQQMAVARSRPVLDIPVDGMLLSLETVPIIDGLLWYILMEF